MKLKMMVLLALFAAGIFASFALAEDGKHSKKADGRCHEVHISGTIAAQALAVTVDKANKKSLIPAGTVLSLAVGSTGQTVRVNVQACATGTGTVLEYSVRQIELRVKTTHTATTETTAATETTKKHGDDEHKGRDEHKGKDEHKGQDDTKTTSTGTTTTAAGTTTSTP
jgi:hypothetical protein